LPGEGVVAERRRLGWLDYGTGVKAELRGKADKNGRSRAEKA